MKKIIFSLSLLAMMAFSCEKVIEPTPVPSPEPEPGEVSYSDMQITEFAYDEIPAEGGSVTPTYAYNYKMTDTDGSTKELTSDALVVFAGNDETFTVDKNTGVITAKANSKMEKVSFEVDINVSKGTTNNHKTITVYQAAAKEEIVKSETVQLPLVLASHKCVYPVTTTAILNDKWLFDTSKEFEFTNTRTDGKTDRDYFDQINPALGYVNLNNTIGIEPECVSSKGVTIMVSGGDLANINTYRSGKIDTVIVAKPTFTTCSNYQFVGDYSSNETEDKSLAPSCSYSNGIWTIEKLKACYYDNTHTLTATVQEYSTSITIKQLDNYDVGKKEAYIVFNNHKLYTQRDNWPNYEDYPVGCSPKWLKLDNGLYQNLDDTKDLHPDNNRYIDFYLYLDFTRYAERNIYISGAYAKSKVVESPKLTSILRGGAKITATANVKLADGSTQTIVHTYEWIQPEKWSDAKNRYSSFTVLVPVIESVAEDFTWTFKFELTLSENHEFDYCRLGADDGNYKTYDWSFNNFAFKDCLYTKEEYINSKNIGGFFEISKYNSNCLPDLTDGK